MIFTPGTAAERKNMYINCTTVPFGIRFCCAMRINIATQFGWSVCSRGPRRSLGTHDFRGFCSARSDVEDTVRTITAFTVERQGDMVLFKVSADGFLYNMVRILVGTLLFVSEGKIDPADLPAIIESGERMRAGKTAPPPGAVPEPG